MTDSENFDPGFITLFLITFKNLLNSLDFILHQDGMQSFNAISSLGVPQVLTILGSKLFSLQ